MTHTKPAREFVIKGKTIIVDEAMLPFIAQYKWHVKKDKKSFYVCTNI